VPPRQDTRRRGNIQQGERAKFPGLAQRIRMPGQLMWPYLMTEPSGANDAVETWMRTVSGQACG
jgi:hypothetical protein